MGDFNLKSKTNLAWLWTMAWRDWKASKKKLYLFIASIVLGISAVVAIQSFGINLKDKIKEDSKKLMGADYIIDTRQIPSDNLTHLIDSLGGATAQQINFASMAFFPSNEGSKLVKVSGFEGTFPIFGELVTAPESAAKDYITKRGALIDATTMLQFNLKIGDSVKIGKITLPIVGELRNIPGTSAISSSIMPPVFIPHDLIQKTGLIQMGSRVGYKYYFKTQPNTDVVQLETKILPLLDSENATIKTHISAGEQLGAGYNNFTNFLNLVAFTALLLGCLGIASATHIYIKEKKKSIAVLKCIGVTRKQTFIIFLLQIMLIGLIGSVIGTTIGIALQELFPLLMADFLPVDISFRILPEVIALGIGLGVIMSVTFSLYPLLSTWFVTPNQVLRAQNTSNKNTRLLAFITAPTIAGTIFLFSYLLLGNALSSIIFLGGILVVFSLIWLLGVTFKWLVKVFFPKKWSFSARQGLSNLYRPGNQTITLILCIGVGVFLINILYLTKDTLISSTSLQKEDNTPNILLLDARKEQLQNIESTIETFDQSVIDQIPVIAMRLNSINGKKVSEIKADTTTKVKEWILDGQFRATYRDSLISSEQLIEGDWIGKTNNKDLIPISMGVGMKNDGGFKIGDQITFNVQGVFMKTEIKSIRRIEWSQMRMNFAVLFPAGVMEKAPQTNVVTTLAPNDQIAASMQQKLVKAFPNLTIIDLRLVMGVVENILSQIAWVINFLALFSILTGFIVLIGAVRTSKYQRLRENAMLRTIGATSKQIMKMTFVEYALLGFLGVISGVSLSVAGAFLLAKMVFKTQFIISWIPVVIIPIVIITLVVLIGIVNNLKVIKTSPKEILRS